MPVQIPTTGNVGEWLQFFSSLSTPVIVGFAVLHLLYFGVLRVWCGRDLQTLAAKRAHEQELVRPGTCGH